MINKFEKFWCEIFLVIHSAQDEDDVKFGQIFSVLVVGLCILGNLLTLSYIIDLCFGLTIPKNWIKVIFYFSIFITVILLSVTYLKYIRKNKYLELAIEKNYTKTKKYYLIYFLTSMTLMLVVINLKFFMQK